MISHKDFIIGHKLGGLNIYVNKSNALRMVSAGYLPKQYYWAHTFWSWVWFILIPAGIALIFIKGVIYGIGLLVLSAFVGSATKKSAMEFVIQHAIDDEKFYQFAVESKTLIIETKLNKDGGKSK